MKSIWSLLLSFQLFAQYNPYPDYDLYPGCLIDEIIPLGQEIDYTEECEVKSPLELKSGRHFFPNLTPNAHNIEYWEGSYSKAIVYYNQSLRVVTNTCTNTVLLQEVQRNRSHSRIINFRVQNPNLNYHDIQATYELVAMTQDEAGLAFQEARLECENYGGVE